MVPKYLSSTNLVFPVKSCINIWSFILVTHTMSLLADFNKSVDGKYFVGLLFEVKNNVC
jgi:hypothetical protein